MFLSVLGNDVKSADVIMWVMQPLMAVTLLMIITVISGLYLAPFSISSFMPVPSGSHRGFL